MNSERTAPSLSYIFPWLNLKVRPHRTRSVAADCGRPRSVWPDL